MEAALINPFVEGILHILDITAFVKINNVKLKTAKIQLDQLFSIKNI